MLQNLLRKKEVFTIIMKKENKKLCMKIDELKETNTLIKKENELLNNKLKQMAQIEVYDNITAQNLKEIIVLLEIKLRSLSL